MFIAGITSILSSRISRFVLNLCRNQDLLNIQNNLIKSNEFPKAMLRDLENCGICTKMKVFSKYA